MALIYLLSLIEHHERDAVSSARVQVSRSQIQPEALYLSEMAAGCEEGVGNLHLRTLRGRNSGIEGWASRWWAKGFAMEASKAGRCGQTPPRLNMRRPQRACCPGTGAWPFGARWPG